MTNNEPMKKPLPDIPLGEVQPEQVGEETFEGQNSEFTIEEFIERKKLQNKILKKLLDKMSENETNNNQ
jgi:hypothetical protein